MRKKLPILGLILGVLLVAIGILKKTKEAKSITIIGGADGPTSIFLAGKVGTNPAVWCVVLGIIVIAVIIFLLRRKHS